MPTFCKIFPDLIIVDDICDGGTTFIKLAQRIDEKIYGRYRLDLYVTHGIFSRGLDVLRPYFNHVYCLHTFLENDQIDTDFLTVLNRGDFL